MPTETETQRKRDEAAILLLLSFDSSDYLAASYLWRKHSPRAYSGLLDESGWRWDETRQRFVSIHGRTLTDDNAKKLAVLLAAAISLEMEDITKGAVQGLTPVDKWQEMMTEKLRSLYLAEMGMAVGGFHRITANDTAQMGGSITDQTGLSYSLNRLDNFAANIRSGKDNQGNDLKEPAALTRASLYGTSANWVYEIGRRLSHRRATDPEKGLALFLYERNVLAPAEHCSDTEFTEGCLEASAAGWQPIGTLSLPGERTCAVNCKCSMSYSLLPPRDDA